eukprot:TRINITY_DN6115_c0_g1_i2.p1 TRINITY_DN6115_c0_g1~~TRINITY_DN6115_c0_g1_i2.p1  ORF type:complete len:467 (-),score=115.94 TRINITY_DN6115_c0_g1_i2:100-1500(-)
MPAICPQCQSTDIVHDSARGDTVCHSCGCVLEENSIVAEIEFVGNANGTSAVVGQHVNSNGPRTYATTSGVTGLHRDSREKTIANGNQKISQLAASSLRIGHQVVEQAQGWFRLALQYNFVQGRQTEHVVAACLYIACRKSKTSHMLIDFSDVLQTSVYTLGNTFLKLCRILHTTVPIIDPSLFIHRFAGKLELPYRVGTFALELVKQMKRDWIAEGRRPAGVCGACLLIAARLHGYKRTQKEVIKAVRICDVTLRKRLIEFEKTTAATLTPDEFQKAVEQCSLAEADPPSFTRNRLKEAAAAKDVNDEADESWMLETPNEDPLEPAPLKIDKAALDAATAAVDEASNAIEVDDTLSDIDDNEMSAFMLSANEAMAKEQIWTEMNKDWIQAQEEKARQEAITGKKPARAVRKRKAGAPRDTAVASTAAEAAAKVQKRMSKKINYAVLETLFNPGPSLKKQEPATPL